MQKKTGRKKGIILSVVVIFIVLAASCGCISNNPDSELGSSEDSDQSQNYMQTSSEKITESQTLQDTDKTGYTEENRIKDSKQSVSYPELIPISVTGSEYSKKTYTTKFEKTEYTVTFDVNRSILAGAQAADKNLADHIAAEPEDVQIEYYKSFFEGSANDVFFEEISRKLRYVRLSNNLNDEEYLEFLIAFVQQIPYDFNAVNTRFPAEVIFDGTGDCDEKSMLLIGLLEKSGYDVSLILFPNKGHAVAGIRIIPQGDTDFRMYRSDEGRKYLFIEATAPAYIGLYPDNYEEAQAVVIPIGDGTLDYRNYNYVAYIVDNKRKIEDRIIFFENQLNQWYEEISALETKLKNPEKYYTSQSEYELDYLDYKKLVENYSEYYTMYEKNIEVYNHILDYPYDVEGVRRTISNSKVNEMEY